MSDLQLEDASREGSQEREDAGEDGAASDFVLQSRPAAAAPATERAVAADSSRKRRREGARCIQRTPTGPEQITHKSRRSVRPRGLVEATRRCVGGASAARVWSPGVRGLGRCVSGKGHRRKISRRRRRAAGHFRHD